MNTLYYGDNLDILRKYIADESVDLIYLDPPLNSNRAYNVIFQDQTGQASHVQIQAFEDTWCWTEDAQDAFDQIMAGDLPVALKEMMRAFLDFMGTSNLMAYLTMMAIRLAELHRVLKPTGSIYLHCDPTASHYLKVLIDQVFGVRNFRNEIIWKRAQPKAHASIRFSNSHDVLLSYAKSQHTLFHPQYKEHDPEYLRKFYKYVEPDTGRRYTLDNLVNPNRNRPNLKYEFPPGSGVVRVWRWSRDRMMKAWKNGLVMIPSGGKVARYKRYLDQMQGASVTDLWVDIEHLHGSQRESIGYPTQKPVALLERVISSVSNEGDVVLDPFCGCGTTIVAAEKLARQWIGIDITHLAIALIKRRVSDYFPDAGFDVVGEPKSVGAAQALFDQSPFQFENWAVSLIGGQPYRSTGGGDTGIDGFLYFKDYRKKFHRIIIEVKGGKYQPRDVRSLAHVIQREKAPLGVLIALHKPIRGMLTQAASMGKWTMPGSKREYPVLHILTVQDYFDGKRPDLPDTSETLKRGQRVLREKEKPPTFL